MKQIARNIGFDGRMFLEEAEWLTYIRRMPVRYISSAKQDCCQQCGQPGDASNPLQNAHVIGFGVGVACLALTPEYLDSAANIVTAHRKTCNRGSELRLRDAMARLRTLKVVSLPEYLPAEVLDLWQAPDAEPAAAPHGRLERNR